MPGLSGCPGRTRHVRRLAAIRNHLRSIFLPERQPQATDARRPKDPALAKRRRRVTAHALETGALMIAFAALLPAAITAITIILRGPEDNFLNHSWETIVGLRGARDPEQDSMILPIVSGVLVASYFFVFQRTFESDRDVQTDESLDPNGEKSFLGLLLGLVLLLGVWASLWTTIPPEAQPIDWVIVSIATPIAYLYSALARLVMSDYVRALQWSHEQWEAWRKEQSRRASALRDSGVDSLTPRRVTIALASVLLPPSIASCLMAAATAVPLFETWTIFALLPSALLACDIFSSSVRRVTRRWSGLVICRILTATVLLAPAVLLFSLGGVWRALLSVWLGSLCYGHWCATRRVGGELDLRLIKSRTAIGSEGASGA